MQSCEVLIVGGGPAGSACAWKLRRRGVDVLVLDKRRFPRDKVCGGWITPQVLEALQFDPHTYAQDRVFQPITGFKVSRMGGPEVTAEYPQPVSYGIRRFEFDEYLLQRSGARLMQGIALTELRRAGRDWLVNGQIATPLIVGAGGHFCPVARHLGARIGGGPIVAAQEVEFPMNARQQRQCAISPKTPELYFCRDMKGYGWCFRKQNYLNVGLGRFGNQNFPWHVSGFAEFLRSQKKIPDDFPSAWKGHAYLLYGTSARKITGDGVLLIGDAAGLAYDQSGEGIRPAIESGLLAADAILAAQGQYQTQDLEVYRANLMARLGKPDGGFRKIRRRIPDWLAGSVAGQLLAIPSFSRHVLVERCFLRSSEPALAPGDATAPQSQLSAAL